MARRGERSRTILAASYVDSKEDTQWNCGVYRGGWRRELHPTALGR